VPLHKQRAQTRPHLLDGLSKLPNRATSFDPGNPLADSEREGHARRVEHRGGDGFEVVHGGGSGGGDGGSRSESAVGRQDTRRGLRPVRAVCLLVPVSR
jgi:hypothetical protein